MYIGQLSKITGVSVRNIRHYENLGLITSSGADEHFRTYQDSDIHTVKMIKMALSVGIKLRDILDIISTNGAVPMVERANGLLDKRAMELAVAIKELHHQREIVDRLKRQLISTSGRLEQQS